MSVAPDKIVVVDLKTKTSIYEDNIGIEESTHVSSKYDERYRRKWITPYLAGRCLQIIWFPIIYGIYAFDNPDLDDSGSGVTHCFVSATSNVCTQEPENVGDVDYRIVF
jgi:hypothetical protein